jgi:hypothetical protein
MFRFRIDDVAAESYSPLGRANCNQSDKNSQLFNARVESRRWRYGELCLLRNEVADLTRISGAVKLEQGATGRWCTCIGQPGDGELMGHQYQQRPVNRLRCQKGSQTRPAAIRAPRSRDKRNSRPAGPQAHPGPTVAPSRGNGTTGWNNTLALFHACLGQATAQGARLFSSKRIEVALGAAIIQPEVWRIAVPGAWA